MKKLSVDLKHCFGIEKLMYQFNFSLDKVFAIYARNGLMKTSFAKIFKKVQYNKMDEIKDLIFDIPGQADIKVDGVDINPDSIYVIESYDSSFEADVSPLLVKGNIKEKLADVFTARNKFFKALEQTSGLKIKRTQNGKPVYELETTIIEDFGFRERSFLLNIGEFNEQPEINIAGVCYKDIFDPIVLKKIESQDFQQFIQNFVNKIEKVYKSYPFLEKGKLTLPKLKNLKKELNNASFFVKSNELYLSGNQKISDLTALNEQIKKIDDDIKGIPELQIIEKNLSDAKGIKLRDVVEIHPEIIPYLSKNHLSDLKRNLWLSYFNLDKVLFNDMKNKYNNLSMAMDTMDLNDTPWKHALDIFNERFSVPFSMEITNLKGAIIGESIPQVEFSFFKDGNTVKIDRSKLENLNTLSQGEKRALYLLNIIFDIEQIKLSKRETIIIADDIADSFDYKNKYAIIEYLYELSQIDCIKLIILSHNFDFYRTIASRLSIVRNNRLFADINDDEIKLETEYYQKHPFNVWKNKPNKKYVLALIPFVRNIIEYGKERNISSYGEKNDYKLLTSLLHEKNDTASITFADIQPLYTEYVDISHFEDDIELSNSVVSELLKVCDNITLVDTKLENKLLLAMGIRHIAEKFMKNKILASTRIFTWNKGKQVGSALDYLNYIDTKGNQTRELSNGYYQIGDSNSKKVISEVNIMTPENIHMNSFMYEPILDMDVVELIHLYTKVKSISC